MQQLLQCLLLSTAFALLPPARFVQPRRHALRAADDDAAALLEAANKLRAEAAALETEAQAEAAALESKRVEQQKAAVAAPAPAAPPELHERRKFWPQSANSR